MTRHPFTLNDKLRGLLLVVVWLTYTALSLLMIIALLTSWPELLHGVGARLGPW